MGGFLNFLLVGFVARESDVIRDGVAEKEVVLWGIGDILPKGGDVRFHEINTINKDASFIEVV